MPSLAASHTVACTSLSLAVSLALDPGVLATQVPAYRVSPAEGSIVFSRAQHPGPFCQWLFVLTLHPARSLVNTGSFVSCEQPKEASVGIARKLRPGIKSSELAVLSPPSLGATKTVRCFSLISLPQLRGHTTGRPPECQGENAAAGTPQPHLGAFLPDRRQAPQTGGLRTGLSP